jgi:cell division protein FtsB
LHRQRTKGNAALLEEQETVWHLLSRFTITLILLGGVAIALTFFIPELERQKQLSREIGVLERERADVLEERNRLRDELRWINDDPSYLEVRARDKLDLYVPGETILRIEENPPADPAS